MPDGDALQRLVADGLLRRESGRTRTTSRWQAAMVRAAARLKVEESELAPALCVQGKRAMPSSS
jgi:hypothetical protein